MPALKVLHIGVSNRGLWPLRECDAETGFVPVALCDVSEAALAVAREKTGLPVSACFTQLDEALAHPDVDCAIVCAPTLLHFKIAEKIIARDLPVLVEKGMAADWATAKQFAFHVSETKAIAAIAQNYRYRAIERTVWRAIHDPACAYYVGAVHQLSYSEQRVRPVTRGMTHPFASIWDMSCHHFDNLLYWLGPVQEITAASWRAAWSAYPEDCNTSAHLVFANGTRVHYIHTHDGARASVDLEVHGERGALFLRNGTVTFSERPKENFGTRSILPVELEADLGERGLLHDFHAYITQGREPAVSVRHNLETMALCEMTVRSLVHKRACQREELNQPVA
ncbi:Gfo/Idh/MocA family protein [Oleiharenicola lentus]|uniref:Gfo/Idh/MocA family protein n=1 Tax=Oleiharenicola lentus TaxID=2508720 RepID=UPI003F66F26B